MEQVGQEYPQVTTDYLHVDAASIFLVTDPARFDVVVTDNLFGDILTDLAAPSTGGIEPASGNINRPHGSLDVRARPRSAPDIAGQSKADPRRPSCPWPSCCATSATRTPPPPSRPAVATDLATRTGARATPRWATPSSHLEVRT